MASATPQRFPGTETTAAIDTAGPAAEGLELRKVNHRIAEVSSLDFSNAVIDLTQIKALCSRASGVNSRSGLSTRETLGCR